MKTKDFKVGDRVEHLKHGKGTVVRLGSFVEVVLDSGLQGSGLDGAWCSFPFNLTLIKEPKVESKAKSRSNAIRIKGSQIIRDGVKGRIIDEVFCLPVEKLPSEYYIGFPTFYPSKSSIHKNQYVVKERAIMPTYITLGEFIPEDEYQDIVRIIKLAGERLGRIRLEKEAEAKTVTPFEEVI